MTAPTWPSGERAARHARLMAGAAALTGDDRRWLVATAGARTTCVRRTPAGRCLLPLSHHGDHHADDTRSDPCA